jgi:hypothetical protein
MYVGYLRLALAMFLASRFGYGQIVSQKSVGWYEHVDVSMASGFVGLRIKHIVMTRHDMHTPFRVSACFDLGVGHESVFRS